MPSDMAFRGCFQKNSARTAHSFSIDGSGTAFRLLRMCKTKNPFHGRGTSSMLFLPAIGRSFARIMLATLLLACCIARAQDVDDQYASILGVVQQGDVLQSTGNKEAALTKYRAAQTGLIEFRKAHPDWNAKIVTYRWNVVAQKIADLTGGAAGGTNTAGGGGTETAPAQGATKAAPSSGRAAKLLEAGSEPRKVLRYHPKPGEKQTTQMTMKIAMETKMGEMQVPPMKFPSIVMTLDTTIKDVTSSGEITYETVITDATMGDEEGANPQIAAAMKTQVSGIKGHTITGAMSDRGVNKKGNAADASAKSGDMVSQIGDSVSDLSAAELPEEAVGAGAKWEVRKPSNSKG